MNSCKICNYKMDKTFEEVIMHKYKIAYFSCKKCGFINTENPYWLKEAYINPINLSDTGLVARNLIISSKVSNFIYFYNKHFISYLDYGGGNGLFVRLMRDIGINFKWTDEFQENIHAKTFEVEKNKKYDFVTLLEVIEHIHNPKKFINELINNYSPKVIYISTGIYKKNIPKKDWWYYSFNTGQHLSFFQNKTLKILANSINYNYYSVGSIHIFSKIRINKIALFLLCGRFYNLFFYFFKRGFKSLTLDDSEKISNKNK